MTRLSGSPMMTAASCTAAGDSGFLQRARDVLLSSEDLQRWQSVASSIQDCMQHVGPWGLGDFAFGLCVPLSRCVKRLWCAKCSERQ
jgi:hypothetical protein